MVIAVGKKAPDFTLVSHEGEEITLTEVLKNGPVALVFFPLAFSGICTGELCELRDNLQVFDDNRVQLFAVSVDSKFALKAWADQEEYKFNLLSDFWPHGEVSKAYDAFVEEAGIATRATVLIGKDGVVVESFETSPGEARNFAEYKAALEKL
ncbi:MAG TPA: peroxiredoxin [Microbacteriaceae bacterium]|nr:peroxiredoxin [Microbacteriaceae bacterium]